MTNKQPDNGVDNRGGLDPSNHKVKPNDAKSLTVVPSKPIKLGKKYPLGEGEQIL